MTANNLCRWLNVRDRASRPQSLEEFVESWSLRDLPDLHQKEFGQAHPCLSCSDLQGAVESLGHIPNLNHLRHVLRIITCDAHGNWERVTAAIGQGRPIDTRTARITNIKCDRMFD